MYSFKEICCEHGVGVSSQAVFGDLSMIFWAVTLIVSIKYMLLVLRADNDGEGGILALLALVLRQVPAAGRVRQAAVGAGLFGAAMFFGECVVTPAISVLSAAEGLQVVSPLFTPYVIPHSERAGCAVVLQTGARNCGGVRTIMRRGSSFSVRSGSGRLSATSKCSWRRSVVRTALCRGGAWQNLFCVGRSVSRAHGGGSLVRRHRPSGLAADSRSMVLAGNAVSDIELLWPGRAGPVRCQSGCQSFFSACTERTAVAPGVARNRGYCDCVAAVISVAFSLLASHQLVSCLACKLITSETEQGDLHTLVHLQTALRVIVRCSVRQFISNLQLHMGWRRVNRLRPWVSIIRRFRWTGRLAGTGDICSLLALGGCSCCQWRENSDGCWSPLLLSLVVSRVGHWIGDVRWQRQLKKTESNWSRF